tara:strand:- start:264 stop:470 length:207 start_codon:yes stop_codon:yes gene_type:complete
MRRANILYSRKKNDNFTLFRIANDEFYQWENELFPNNTTPYSDDDRILWCEGFVKAKLQNNQNGVIKL